MVRPVAVDDENAGGGVLANPDGLMQPGGEPTRIERSAGDGPALVIDFGQNLRADMIIETVASSSAEIGLAFSESREFLSRHSDVSWGSHRTQFWRPGRGKDDFRAQETSFRYVMLFLNENGWVEIDHLRAFFKPFHGAPETYEGCFESSDELLTEIWYAGAYTLELNTTMTDDGPGMILDGAKRDRAVWVGDLALQALIEYGTHASGRPVRNSLADLADHQRPDGSIPPTSWDGYRPVLYDYSAWWVQAFVDYFRYTGDRGFVEEYFPNLREQMEWFTSVTGPNGLLVVDDGLEWSWSLARRGEVTYTNLVYYQALLDAAELAERLGYEDDARTWRERAADVERAINHRLFDQERGVYVNSERDRRAPQDANVLAVLYGVAAPADQAGVLAFLREHHWTEFGSTTVDVPYGSDSDHDKRIWPFMGYYEVAARFVAGDEAGAYELMRRQWGHMLRSDPGSTMWEWMTADGEIEEGFASLAHGWSAGPTVALTQHTLGVQPTHVGFRRFDVVPRPGDLDWARGRVPTPYGGIDVDWERSGEPFVLMLTVPLGTDARAAVPTFGQDVTVTVDGKTAWEDGVAQSHDASLDDGYVHLELGPGEWRVESAPVDEPEPRAPLPDPETASPDWNYYPETGHYLAGGFRAFWERSGGVRVFGFPLTEEFDEVNPDLEEVHTVQYFERQRFEYHPQHAGTPYEVQLGRLGYADAAARGLLDSEPFEPSIDDDNTSGGECDRFEVTGFSVCGEFLEYWQAHGLEFGDTDVSYRESLALFGYPISQAYVDEETGLLTQYFERARFELHPDNSEGHGVLLGRLAADLIDQRD